MFKGNKRILRFFIGSLMKIILPNVIKKRNIYSKLSFTRDVKIKFHNEVFSLHCFNEEISNSIFYTGLFGDYEGKTIELWHKLISGLEVTEVYDVGSNIGIFSLVASVAKPQASIHAFDPNPIPLGVFKKNISLNQFKNIHIYDYALSTSTSKEQFYNFGSSTSPGLTSVKHKHIDSTLAISSFNTKDINEFRGERNTSISIIKLDIERAELKLLKHGYDILKHDRPIIFLEILDEEDYNSFDILFKGLSYELIKINDELKTFSFCSKIEGEDKVGRNWICFPRESREEIYSLVN